MAPEEKSLAALEIGRWQIAAEGVAEAGVFVPIANVCGRYPVRAADRIEQSSQPALGIVDGCAALGAFGEDDRLGAVAFANVQNTLRDVVEGFVPGNALPAGIGVAFGTRALKRIVAAIALVNQLRRGFALAAYNAAVRMIVIGVEAGHAAVFDRRDGRAVRCTKGAITANRTCFSQ